MPAYSSVELSSIPLSRWASSVGVYRYSPAIASFDRALEYLPHIRVISIELREGPDPGLARFRYVLDPTSTSDHPHTFEEILSVDSVSPGVVGNDDRLLVLTWNPDGSPLILFDGFAQVPELRLTSSMEEVTFLAFGVAVRCWDQPVGGALMRNADRPSVLTDAPTDLEVRFNPLGEPNASPLGADSSSLPEGPDYPVFLDPLVVREPDIRRRWTLPMAVRYLCFHENPHESLVSNPDPELIDALLLPRQSSTGTGSPPASSDSDESQAIEVPDYIATGKSWPEAVHDLIEPEGFGMTFRLEMSESGDPTTRLDLFRRQDSVASSVKDLLLQPVGSILDPGQSNVGQAHLARDVTDVANEFVVDSALVRHEASFILSPGFSISASDAQDSAALNTFNLNHPDFTSNREKYRLYVLDETGEGHWSWASSSLVQVPTLLDTLFQDDAKDRSPVIRRRVPLAELFSTDANARPMRARLSISTDYAGTQPGLWDGTGTWQTVGGGFELLKDRVGIWINVPNPNGWNIQANRTSATPYPSGIVKGVEDQAKSGSRRFVLRLTCVVEGDHHSQAIASRRPCSSVTYTVRRRIDARSRYFKHVISKSSEFNTSGNDRIIRDDGPVALAEAEARRLTHESGQVAGRVTIPRFTAAYQIGDRVRSIQGRNLCLRTNAGAPSVEGEVFPTVVGITWDFDGQQQTTLQLSDHRADLS